MYQFTDSNALVTFPFSTRLVTITIRPLCRCQTIRHMSWIVHLLQPACKTSAQPSNQSLSQSINLYSGLSDRSQFEDHQSASEYDRCSKNVFKCFLKNWSVAAVTTCSAKMWGWMPAVRQTSSTETRARIHCATSGSVGPLRSFGHTLTKIFHKIKRLHAINSTVFPAQNAATTWHFLHLFAWLRTAKWMTASIT